MSNLKTSASPSPASHASDQVPLSLPVTVPLPVLRIPMLDRERQLFAYEVMFPGNPDDEQELLRNLLSTITDGALTRLVRGNRTFLNMPVELLPEDSDVLLDRKSVV